ncbi:MAG: transcriptional repressor LexA [Oscillospiraceae bacterium]|nr:transcriptional repressor LexA [Oscillospiraceae bacterium]
MEKLGKTQQRVYDFVVKTIEEQGYPPSVREIGDALGLKSPSTVHFHLKHLEELGYIEKGAGKGRAIALKREEPAATPTADWQEETTAEVNRVPIVGNVAAGSPILAQECIEDYLTFDTGGRSGEYFALRVRGESMLGVGILPDDLVVVRRQQTAVNGEIVVALIGEEATVKTFSKKNGEIWLLPANPDYSPIDGRECEVLGKVVAVVRQY